MLENLYLRELGLSESQIGRILSLQSVGTVVVAVPASFLVTRMTLRSLLIASAILTAVAYAVLVTAKPFTALLAASCLAGAGFIVHNVVSAPFFMRNSGPTERLHLFGVNWAVDILASVIGVAGGGWLARTLGTSLGSSLLGLRFTLLLAAFLVLAAVIPYLFLRSAVPTPEERRAFRLWPIRQPRLLAKLLLPVFLMGCGAGLIIPFLNLYFRDRFALDTAAIGRVFAVSQGLTAAGFLIGPVLARRFGRIRTVVSTEFLSIPFFLALAFTHRQDVAVTAFWLRGTLMNMNQPIANNFAMEVVAPEQQAFTNAMHSLSWNLSWMVATLLGGWLIENRGFTPPMLITVGLYLASAILYLAFFHDHERRFMAADGTPELVPERGGPA